jgi:hypothetical protein
MKIQILVDGVAVPYRDTRLSLEQQVLEMWLNAYGDAPFLEDKDVILHRIGGLLAGFWDFGQGFPTPRSFDRSANRSKCFNYIRQHLASQAPENPVRDFLDQCFVLSDDPMRGFKTGRLWGWFQEWYRYVHRKPMTGLGYKQFNSQLRLIAAHDPQSRFAFQECSRKNGYIPGGLVGIAHPYPSVFGVCISDKDFDGKERFRPENIAPGSLFPTP